MKLSLTLFMTGLLCTTHAIVDEFPVVVVQDDFGYWRPITFVSLGDNGTSHVPLLIDTGSQTIAMCNTTDPGTAESVDKYGCEAYGGYPGDPYGWNGTFYNVSLSFGDGNLVVTDPSYAQVAIMDEGVETLCNDGAMEGIMGVSLYLTSVFLEPQLAPAKGNCEYTPTGGTCCAGNTTSIPPQFAEDMLTEANLYTYGFIGLSPFLNGSFTDNTNETTSATSVMAFGKRARELVLEENSVGTTSFSRSELGLNWFTFEEDVVFSFSNLPNCSGAVEGLDDDCTATVSIQDDPNSYVIIDSGTNSLVLPFGTSSNCSDLFEAMTNETTLSIGIGEVQLELLPGDLALFYEMGTALECGGGPSSATLGFPIFWLYDILFDVNLNTFYQEVEADYEALQDNTTVADAQSTYGDVTFYKRLSDALYDEDALVTMLEKRSGPTPEETFGSKQEEKKDQQSTETTPEATFGVQQDEKKDHHATLEEMVLDFSAASATITKNLALVGAAFVVVLMM